MKKRPAFYRGKKGLVSNDMIPQTYPTHKRREENEEESKEGIELG
jgi:hypothetical protein